jgi:hypothetical protein
MREHEPVVGQAQIAGQLPHQFFRRHRAEARAEGEEVLALELQLAIAVIRENQLVDLAPLLLFGELEKRAEQTGVSAGRIDRAHIEYDRAGVDERVVVHGDADAVVARILLDDAIQRLLQAVVVEPENEYADHQPAEDQPGEQSLHISRGQPEHRTPSITDRDDTTPPLIFMNQR